MGIRRKALIFDNDGVIVDSEASQVAAWREFFGLHGKHVPVRQLPLMTRGRTALDVIRTVFPQSNDREQWTLAQEREKIHMALLRKGLRPVAGIAAFLKEARRRGLKLAVGTSGRRFKLDYILAELGIGTLFDTLVTSEDVALGKPAPDVFLTAARRLGVAPSECLVFEDSFNGVEAASRAGMPAVVLTTSHKKEEFTNNNIIDFLPDFRDPDLIFSSILK